MATNADYFRDSLRLIGVLGESDSLSAEQGADVLVAFNDLLDDLRNDGIELGIEPQSSTTATLSVPEGTKKTIKYLLAVHCAPLFQVPIPAEVGVLAKSGYDNLLRDAVYSDSISRDFLHLPYRRGGGFNIDNG